MTQPHPIALQLAQARRAAGLTQRAVAARAHVSSKSIYHWENGITSPAIVDLAAWAAALGLRVVLAKEAPRGR